MIAKPTHSTGNSSRTSAEKNITTGNPFQNPQVSNLYPGITAVAHATRHERIEKRRDTNVAAHDQVPAPASTVLESRSFGDRLIGNVDVNRREYQLSAATRIIRAFTGDQYLSEVENETESTIGSILLRGSSESGKMIIALLIVQHLQSTLGVTVAWAANTRRLNKLQGEISERGFDAEIQLIDVHDVKTGNFAANQADLLIMDQNSMDCIETVDALGEQVDPQIVLGLTSGIFLKKEIRECFDAEVCCTAKVRQRDTDKLPQQEKLPRMPVV